MPERIMLKVWVNLDELPGTFHTKENAREVVEQILKDRIKHYNPMVLTTGM